MKSICGIDCEKCQWQNSCNGCGPHCVAAEYIKVGGKEKYEAFKHQLVAEINNLLNTLGIPSISTLYELVGAYVNLPYPLPSGDAVKLLDDNRVYLGAQIEVDGLEKCFGVVADTNFILICTYGENGRNPELIRYHKR